MITRAQKLEGLRALINDTHLLGAAKETLSFTGQNLNLPCGALVSIHGFGKTTKTVQFLAEHPALWTAWIEESFSIYPCALFQQNVALHQVLFTEAGSQALWTGLQVLKSGLFKIVIICAKFYEHHLLRKLQLAAEKAQAVVILLTEKPLSSWAIGMHL